MASTSIDNGVFVEELTKTIQPKLLNDSPLPESCCIFRVPDKIRRKNVQAYEPDIVSIGPFHRGRSGGQFQLMENVKRWYLQRLLSQENITLETLIEGIMDLDERARNCYAEPLDLNKKDFLEMMVFDGCFLVELFRNGFSISKIDRTDPVFRVNYMLGYLHHDLLLLENQLPWFVLERLYNITAVGNASFLADLVQNFFGKFVGDDDIEFQQILHPAPNIMHILDLMRTMIVAFEDFGYQQNQEDPLPKLSKRQRLPNVTTLSEAGIEFQKSSRMDIKFETGVLTIPRLAIDQRTEPLFRNLIAFEQYCHKSLMITSYAVLMDNLIDSSKDIDLLSDKEILTNLLSPEDAAQFFNHLHGDTEVIRYYYGRLCNDVNNYYNTDWNKWMEKLRRDYFSTPWAIISLVAAFILLVLTMLQTVYTIHQYYHPPK